MNSLWYDLRYALRKIRQDLRFSAIVIFTLALGIGANTTIFSAVNAILLGSLPYREPDRLLSVWRTVPAADFFRGESAPPDFREYRDRNGVFEQLGAYYVSGFNLSEASGPERVYGAPVTANIFQVLGVDAVRGRTFNAEEEQYGNHRVAVLSYGLWQRRFGLDPNITSKTVEIDGQSYSVVGVMPEDFWFPKMPPRVDIWVPLAFEPNSYLNTRKNYFLSVIGRLKPGVTVEQAGAEMALLGRSLAQQFPEHDGFGATVVSYREEFVGDIRLTLLVLLGAVGFVLLIACANVANLLLARAATRNKEIAIRTAIGATRWRLVRQLLSESILMALLGGVLGLLLAYYGVSVLSALMPDDIARGMQIGVEPRVLVFTLALSILTGVIFGLAPALQASKSDLNETLKEGGRSGAATVSNGLRNLLVIAEVAFAIVLLVGAGLMIKSVLKLRQVEPGFNPQNVVTMMISLPDTKYNQPQQKLAFFQQLVQRLETSAGVQSVGASMAMPLAGGRFSKLLSIEGRPPATSMGKVDSARYRQITPNYFNAMGMTLLKGRPFSNQDAENSPGVAIVNEALVKQHFPDEDPLGKRIWLGPPENLTTTKFPRLTIVGVVNNVRFNRLDEPDRPTVYVPHAQGGTEVLGTMFVAVRTLSEPANFAAEARRQVQALDSAQPLADVMTMEGRIAGSLGKHYFIMTLFGIFGTVALLLAAMGVYGLLAYFVSQRTREIGIRMALGARQRDVLKMMLRQGVLLTVCGVVLGLLAALAVTRVMSSLLFEVSAADPLIFVWVSLVLIGIALLASYIPARRAAQIDPLVAMRYE